MPAFEIEISKGAAKELKSVRAFERRRIIEEIDNQLTHQPTEPTRNRKRLDSAVPDFEHVPPIWELRVGEYRVFYDVDETALTVAIRAVRRTEQAQITRDVINEGD